MTKATKISTLIASSAISAMSGSNVPNVPDHGFAHDVPTRAFDNIVRANLCTSEKTPKYNAPKKGVQSLPQCTRIPDMKGVTVANPPTNDPSTLYYKAATTYSVPKSKDSKKTKEVKVKSCALVLENQKFYFVYSDSKGISVSRADVPDDQMYALLLKVEKLGTKYNSNLVKKDEDTLTYKGVQFNQTGRIVPVPSPTPPTPAPPTEPPQAAPTQPARTPTPVEPAHPVEAPPSASTGGAIAPPGEGQKSTEGSLEEAAPVEQETPERLPENSEEGSALGSDKEDSQKVEEPVTGEAGEETAEETVEVPAPADDKEETPVVKEDAEKPESAQPADNNDEQPAAPTPKEGEAEAAKETPAVPAETPAPLTPVTEYNNTATNFAVAVVTGAAVVTAYNSVTVTKNPEPPTNAAEIVNKVQTEMKRRKKKSSKKNRTHA